MYLFERKPFQNNNQFILLDITTMLNIAWPRYIYKLIFINYYILYMYIIYIIYYKYIYKLIAEYVNDARVNNKIIMRK